MKMTRATVRTTSTGGVLVFVLAIGALTGCSATPADLQPGTAAKLQERLQILAGFAAEKNFAATGTELDLLAGDVSTAAANGDLSPRRRKDIDVAIDLIRADLAALAHTPAHTRTPTPVHAPAPPATLAPVLIPAHQTPVPVIAQPTSHGNGKDKSHANGKDK